MSVYQSCLDDRESILSIDFQDLTHAREFDNDSAIDRQGAARKSGAGAPRRKTYFLAREQLQYFGCLFSCVWEDDRPLRMLVLRQSIAFIDQQLFGLSQNVLAANDRAQI